MHGALSQASPPGIYAGHPILLHAAAYHDIPIDPLDHGMCVELATCVVQVMSHSCSRETDVPVMDHRRARDQYAVLGFAFAEATGPPISLILPGFGMQSLYTSHAKASIFPGISIVMQHMMRLF
jgi:hypothetical protein